MAIEEPATVCDGAFEIGEGRNAQMIRHMRHGSSPRLMALQPIRVLDPGESPAGSISRSPYDMAMNRNTNEQTDKLADAGRAAADEAARAARAVTHEAARAGEESAR